MKKLFIIILSLYIHLVNSQVLTGENGKVFVVSSGSGSGDVTGQQLSDSTQHAIDSSTNYTDSEISNIDSSWQVSKHDTIEGNTSDTIDINATVKFEGGIRITTVTESFSVSKTISFIDQYYAEMTITNNTVITIEKIPEGTSPQLALIWSGGAYTVSLGGATQMSGNSTISFQEVDGAVDLVQFKKINDIDYYSIINIVTP